MAYNNGQSIYGLQLLDHTLKSCKPCRKGEFFMNCRVPLSLFFLVYKKRTWETSYLLKWCRYQNILILCNSFGRTLRLDMGIGRTRSGCDSYYENQDTTSISPFCHYTPSPRSSRLPLTWTLEFICKLGVVGKGGTSFPARNLQSSKIYHPVNHANEKRRALPSFLLGNASLQSAVFLVFLAPCAD